MDQEPVVIIGAGPAGIATAVSLAELGVRSVIIDREGQVAASWRGRYDRLKLDTNKWFSRLPGRPYPKGTPSFPTRIQVADYFERHAQIDGIDHRLNTAVERVDPLADGGWQLQTSGGYIAARHVSSRPVGRTPRHSGVARLEHLHGRIAALVDIPQLGAVRREAGLGGRLGRVGNGYRSRSGNGRRGQGVAGRAHATKHPVAQPARGDPWRSGPSSDVSPAPSVADAILRFLRSVSLGDLSESGAHTRGGRLRRGSPARHLAVHHRHGCDRRDQAQRDRGGPDRRVRRHRRCIARRWDSGPTRGGDRRDRLPAWARIIGRPSGCSRRPRCPADHGAEAGKQGTVVHRLSAWTIAAGHCG